MIIQFLPFVVLSLDSLEVLETLSMLTSLSIRLEKKPLLSREKKT